MPVKSRLVLCFFATAALSACGSPGVPVPPSLELPKPVKDLRAVRKGDKVVLTWTAPTLTTDRHSIRNLGDTQVCRNPGEAMKQCASVAKAPRRPSEQQTQSKSETTFNDELTPSVLVNANPSSVFFYAVIVPNSYGRSAGLSNQVQIPAAPTLPPPSGFRADLTPEGVRLSWTPVSPVREIPNIHFSYRVYRREQGGMKDEIAGEVPVASDSPSNLLDRSFTWEETYIYRATIVTIADERSVEGDDTPAVTVVAHDIFPPAAPAGLQAVFSGPGQKPSIDLIWHPNTESDLAGYNLYRHEQGTTPARINSDLVKAPAFRDENVSSGHQYWYSITAIDLRGNESPHSEETSEAVP